MAIPFNKPFIIGDELANIAQAVHDGHLAGNGAFTKRCQKWLQTTYGIGMALLTNSCTAALEMTALLADIGPGDEVVLPSFTFVSTANAFALRGASLRFVDIRPDTFNLDENLVESAITPRTKAIVAVHYGGVACNMEALGEIASRRGVMLIEDAAQAVNCSYRERWLGGIGSLGCYSFHETKNFISGEGGALLINDDRMAERAEIIWEKGTDRSRFFRGQVDKYSWVDIGSSFLPSELVAAFLSAQLERASIITARRLEIHRRYTAGFADLVADGIVGTQRIPADRQHNGHLFVLLLDSLEQRTRFIAHLKAHGIDAVFHYVPLHSSPMGIRMDPRGAHLPVTDSVSDRLVRLPCFFGLHPDEQDFIIDTSRKFLT